MTDVMTTRALAALLSYPTADLQEAMPDILSVLQAEAVLVPTLPAMRRLCATLQDTDLLDLQEAYVGLFDRTRSVSLHLFEHVYGDSRDRGPAMVELAGLYAGAGLEPVAGELPDFLPMLLEFAALDPARGTPILADAAPVIDMVRARLAAREHPYAAALHAVLLLAGARPSQAAVPAEPEQTAEELDRAWEEAAVVFGPGANLDTECGAASVTARRSVVPPSQRPVIRHVAAASQG